MFQIVTKWRSFKEPEGNRKHKIKPKKQKKKENETSYSEQMEGHLSKEGALHPLFASARLRQPAQQRRASTQQRQKCGSGSACVGCRNEQGPFRRTKTSHHLKWTAGLGQGKGTFAKGVPLKRRGVLTTQLPSKRTT